MNKINNKQNNIKTTDSKRQINLIQSILSRIDDISNKLTTQNTKKMIFLDKFNIFLAIASFSLTIAFGIIAYQFDKTANQLSQQSIKMTERQLPLEYTLIKKRLYYFKTISKRDFIYLSTNI